MQAYVAQRVYDPDGKNQDSVGKYNGWSQTFDSWISIFSPKIAPYLSKTDNANGERDEVEDETIDEIIKPLEGHSRVWAVPRKGKCTSKMFL
jgi:hypothetical protein